MISDQAFMIFRVISILFQGSLAFVILRSGSSKRLPSRLGGSGGSGGEQTPQPNQTRPIGLPLLLVTILFVSIEFMLQVILGLMLGIGIFGLIHLSYDALFMALPTVAGALLLISCRRTSPGGIRLTRSARGALLLIGLVIPLVGVYATFIEPFRVQLEVHQVQIERLPPGKTPLRIGVLADIQTAKVTDHERKALERLMALEPDLILIPGDLFSGQDSHLPAHWDDLLELLQRLEAPGGVYFVPGNNEELYDERVLLKAAGIRYLRNEIVEITLGDRVIRLAGLELQVEREGAFQTIRDLETLPGDADLRILLSHRPDSIFHLPSNGSVRTDLVVAGHTHGGQVVVPFWGPLMTASAVPRQIAAGGLHELDGRRIYVSRGLGWEGGRAPRIRFFCPPEITVLEIE